MNAPTEITSDRVKRDLLNLFDDVFGELLDDSTIDAFGGYGALVKAFEATHSPSIQKIFRYCVEGRISSQWDVIPTVSLLFTLSTMCKKFGGSLSESRYRALANLEALYTARSRLDGDAGTEGGPEPLEVKDIAVLAGMSENSVRNAISRSELSYYKDGNSTLISNSAARAWLAKRRGFRRTQYDNDSLDAYINPANDPIALGQYLTSKRIESQGYSSVDELLSRNPAANLTATELTELESGNLIIPISRLHQIADIYQEDAESFIETLVEVYRVSPIEGTKSDLERSSRDSFTVYERDEEVERQFGKPDFIAWEMYKSIEQEATKNGVVRALHIILAASGRDIEYTRDVINKYTLALYRKNNSGEYLSDAYKNPRSYSEPHWYGFIYDDSIQWNEEPSKRHTQLNKTEIALQSRWAKQVMATEDVAQSDVDKLFRMLMKRYG